MAACVTVIVDVVVVVVDDVDVDVDVLGTLGVSLAPPPLTPASGSTDESLVC